MKENPLYKYFLRYLPLLIVVIPIRFISIYYLTNLGNEFNAIRLFLDKVSMVIIAWCLAEFMWALFFKKVLGNFEVIKDPNVPPSDLVVFGIFLFRGFLYASTILALSLGL